MENFAEKIGEFCNNLIYRERCDATGIWSHTISEIGAHLEIVNCKEAILEEREDCV